MKLKRNSGQPYEYLKKFIGRKIGETKQKSDINTKMHVRFMAYIVYATKKYFNVRGRGEICNSQTHGVKFDALILKRRTEWVFFHKSL